MQWRNTPDGYGLVAIFLHWLVALAVIGLFVLGLWMVDLGYYDNWYRTAPFIHKSVGILLFMVVALRLLWRLTNPKPSPIGKPAERRLAQLVHLVLYGLLFAIMIAGYLISTADGRPIEVFGWFEVPATITGITNQEDIAGVVHLWLAWGLIGLVVLHALAALKHHFLNKDRTLRRMLRP
ncbi:MAG TPA: cytochrome b [Thioalkalivibrio sp.]|nr:cytochrome b [Thioalkalivibrio sp.]